MIPRGIVIHHSASPVVVNNKAVDVDVIRKWHVQGRKFRDVGYHYVVLPSGVWQPGRPEYDVGAHCKDGGRNFTHLGICLIGDFTIYPVPGSQLLGTILLVQQLMDKYGIQPSDVEFHKDVPGAHTICPGPHFPENIFRKLIDSKECAPYLIMGQCPLVCAKGEK